MNVHFDDAGVGRDLEVLQTRVARRRIALQQHRHVQLGRRRLDGRDEVEEVLDVHQRRQEHYSCPSRGSTQSAVRTTPSASGAATCSRTPSCG